LNAESARGRILAVFPELQLKTIEAIGRGWDSTAFLVNGETVFRLPNDGTTTQDAVRAEVNLLAALRGRLPVAIPDPKYIAPDFSFFGYGYLRGEPLDRRPELFTAQLWIDVVVAVETVVPVSAASDLGIHPFDGVAHRLDLVRRTRDQAHLTDPVNGLADAVVCDYEPRYDQAARARPITMHGDLGLSHWLVDDADDPYAVFDWSDVCTGPIEHALADLRWTPEAWPSIEEVSARYAKATGHRPDRELIDLDHWANVLSDVGAMLESGTDASSPDILRLVAHLEQLAISR
jgi:aminoglycoside phosphotransferase (APT) family kinase protein